MFNTLPYNYFPASTAKFEEGKNDAIQAEIDAIKDGTNIDSFGDVETALSLKVNSADMETALATKTNLSNIAPTFDSESGTYDIGEQVIYEGVLYEFISAHDTPGDWDSTEVQAVKISELIDTLNSKLNTLESGLVDRAKVCLINVPVSKVDINGFLGHILGTIIEEQEIGSYVVHGAWDTHDYYTGLVYKLASNIAIGIIHYGTDNFSLYSASYMLGQYIRYKVVQYSS